MAFEKIDKYCCSILILVLCVFIGACGSKERVYVDKPYEVKIPVVTVPSIKPVARPSLEINKLNKNSTSKDVAEAYYNTVKQLVHYSKSLEALLEPFYSKYKEESGNAGN